MRKTITLRQFFFVFTAIIFGFFLFPPHVAASGFNLKSIGGVNTDGKLYPQWWYTGFRPTLSGDAPGSSAVTVSIDGVSYSTAGNAAGQWAFTPPTDLAAGDHAVVLTNNGSSISFTLTLGPDNVDWTKIGTGGGTTLPTVGNITPTLTLAGLGLLLVFPALITLKTKE